MSLFLINIVLFLLAGIGCLVVGSIVINNPPINDPPGFGIRLRTYLTNNVAETRRNHRFPELELPCYTLPPAPLFSRVERAVMILGWEVMEVDTKHYRLHAVAVTPLLKFKDDIEIQLLSAPCGTELHIRSTSRVGQGDLGANTRHILNLMDVLGQRSDISGDYFS